MIKWLYYIIIIGVFLSCKPLTPINDFSLKNAPSPPNYSDLSCWVAHPLKADFSDKFPKNFSTDTTIKGIDVFFIYPTLLLKGEQWNASVEDKKLNKKINTTAIKYQANVFNGLANIYAPLYRQMHIHGYRSQENGVKALDLAYQDVEKAFIHYLENFNNGNQIVIAAHSQGTNHAERLIKDYVLKNEKILSKVKLAYLIGMPIKAFSDNFPACENPKDINCFLSWRTFASGHYPSYVYGDEIAVSNPISWKNNTAESDFENHLGILMKNNKIRYNQSVNAQVNQGLLWIKFQNIPLKKLFERPNYHIADYNLFWSNIRLNFIERMSE